MTATASDRDSDPRLSLLWVLPFAALGVGVLLRLGILPNHDVAWLQIAASRLLDGGTYEEDFFEVNPPLAIGIYVPSVWLSRALGWGLPAASDAIVFLLIIQSLFLAGWLIRAGESFAARSLPLFTAWLALVLACSTGFDFGQREHFAAILLLPFLFLMGQGREHAGPGPRAWIALLAAIGCLIKPHYAALPFLLLGLRAFRCRSWSMLFGIEGRILLAGALFYPLAVWLWFSGWLVCARWAAALYGGFSSDVGVHLLQLHGLMIVPLCILFQWILRARDPVFARQAEPFLVATLYALLVGLMQFKGWQYHFVPASIFAFANQGLALAALIDRSRPETVAPLSAFRVVAAGLIFAAAGSMFMAARDAPTVLSLGKVPEALRSVAQPHDPVFTFSVEMTPALPAVPLLGMDWASRYSSLWPLPSLLQASMHADAESQALIRKYGQALIDSVREDFERYRPRVVLVDRRPLPGLPAERDALSFFTSDVRFASIWSRYVEVGTVTYPGNPRGLAIYVSGDPSAVRGDQSSGS